MTCPWPRNAHHPGRAHLRCSRDHRSLGELSALRRLCRSAAGGAGGVVLVEGIAGLGKTALLRALVADVPDLRSWWGRVPEGGQAPAYWPWREIAATAGWDVDWTDAQDAWSLGARVASAARAAATRQPLLLLVDDLHAADDDTVRMTVYLASVLQDSPIALVVASRPDERLSPLARTGTTLALAPLAEDEADEIITLHAAGPLPDRDRAEIRAVAEGNPLVLRAALYGVPGPAGCRARSASRSSNAWRPCPPAIVTSSSALRSWAARSRSASSPGSPGSRTARSSPPWTGCAGWVSSTGRAPAGRSATWWCAMPSTTR